MSSTVVSGRLGVFPYQVHHAYEEQVWSMMLLLTDLQHTEDGMCDF
jgi:hypothetical protein